MSSPADQFVELSSTLTGFGRIRLLGTGMSAAYMRTVCDAVPAEVVEELLAVAARLGDAADREATIRAEILDDPKLGPVARSIILMWYCGTWAALSGAWHVAYGDAPLDISRVVSGEAYQQGLQWVVAGTHPMGARQQGYGAWAAAPDGDGA